MQLYRGMLVRLEMTGALFEVREVKESGQVVISSGLSRLTVRPEMLEIVADFNHRSRAHGEEVMAGG